MAESDHNGSNPFCHQNVDAKNWSDTKIADEMLTSALATVLQVKVFIPLVFIIGFVGNVAFLLLLARVKMMRTITNFYLANLAAADTITLSLITMSRLWKYVDFKQVQVKSSPFHSNFGCGMYSFTIHLSSLSSILFITIVSFDRYFAICHPLQYRNTKIKTRGGCFLTSLIWITSAVLSFLRSLASGKLVYICIRWPPNTKYRYFPDRVRRCKPINPFFEEEILEHVVHSVPFVAALITNAIINIRILQRLTKPSPGENGNKQIQHIKRRITWMLLANSLIFFSCLAPFHFLLLFGRLLNLSHLQQEYYVRTAFVFNMLNSAINPILYGVASPSYRRGFLKAFGFTINRIEPMEIQETERTPAN